ncbi:hypothetical protein GCM10010383_18960 [Streptomyces lomondensis]|uniref:Uncharacterized protein n=1 Tax=Streptomyces lomondensis TaxID=68229 RepID=A0ABQ2X0R5_9ACTN|nr:hypothetical protein GCM10010383_18960 [Streptomyces lomondensis]
MSDTRRHVSGIAPSQAMCRRRPGPPPPTGEAPAVARYGPRGGPYYLQRPVCVFCHTPPCHGLVASWADMDGEWFQVVTCLSRQSGGGKTTATTCGLRTATTN